MLALTAVATTEGATSLQRPVFVVVLTLIVFVAFGDAVDEQEAVNRASPTAATAYRTKNRFDTTTQITQADGQLGVGVGEGSMEIGDKRSEVSSRISMSFVSSSTWIDVATSLIKLTSPPLKVLGDAPICPPSNGSRQSSSRHPDGQEIRPCATSVGRMWRVCHAQVIQRLFLRVTGAFRLPGLSSRERKN
jgi:hypothetical protein